MPNDQYSAARARKSGAMGRVDPLTQDSAVDLTGTSLQEAISAGRTNEWRQANPEAAAYQDAGYDESWIDKMIQYGVIGAGIAITGGAIAPYLGGGAAASGAGTTAGASAAGTTAGTTAAIAPTVAGTATTAGAGGGFLSSIGGVPGLLQGVGTIGEIAGNLSQGRAEGRQAEANYLLGRDRLSLDRAALSRNDAFRGANLDLDRRDQSSRLDQENARRANVLRLMEQTTPSVQVPEHIAARMPAPAAPDPKDLQNREDIISRLRPRVLDSLEKGQQYAPLTLEDLPDLSTPPAPSGLDRALNIIGGMGSFAGAAGDIYSGRRRAQPAPPVVNPAIARQPITRGLRIS